MTRFETGLAATALAVACGAAAAAAQTTVTMWTFLDPNKTSPREVALKQMIETSRRPIPSIKIKVEPQDFAQMPPKFFLGHRTGSNPDLVWIDAKNLGGLSSRAPAPISDPLMVAQVAAGAARRLFREGRARRRRRRRQSSYALPLFHGASVDLLSQGPAASRPASIRPASRAGSACALPQGS